MKVYTKPDAHAKKSVYWVKQYCLRVFKNGNHAQWERALVHLRSQATDSIYFFIRYQTSKKRKVII